MLEYLINGVNVIADEGITESEAKTYIKYIKENNPGQQTLEKVELKLENEDVLIKGEFKPVPFEKIRRITGYLVGTLDRFNDGKRAEERDRIKHK